MSPPSDTRSRVRQSFPRVSGDEPGIATMTATVNGFSPRERG